LCFATYGILRKCKRIKNAGYVYGFVTDNHSGSRGTWVVGYDFYVNRTMYHNTMPKFFFAYCRYACCRVGDTVIVRYESENPKNSDIVKSVPEGDTIQTIPKE
jgi:hypothetical protein